MMRVGCRSVDVAQRVANSRNQACSACDIAANARAIGIGPTGGHASTSVPGTSRAMALRSSVASLR